MHPDLRRQPRLTSLEHQRLLLPLQGLGCARGPPAPPSSAPAHPPAALARPLQMLTSAMLRSTTLTGPQLLPHGETPQSPLTSLSCKPRSECQQLCRQQQSGRGRAFKPHTETLLARHHFPGMITRSRCTTTQTLATGAAGSVWPLVSLPTQALSLLPWPGRQHGPSPPRLGVPPTPPLP